jgi:plastocyanin domain-containing protein
MPANVAKRLFSFLLVSFVAIGALFAFGQKVTPTTEVAGTDAAVDGTVRVKAGYYPREIVLPANRETVLRLETKDTYDCSASFSINKLGIERFLPPNGFTDITLPAQPEGSEIIAGCSMGMYSFKIKFQ